MSRIGLIDFDGKIVNLALMKLSTHHKSQGHEVLLNDFTPNQVDKVFCSVIFDKDRAKAAELANVFPAIEFGGTGWDIAKTLPPEIENCLPDYDLYRAADIFPRINGIMTKAKKLAKAQTIVDAGIGFTTRGCVRTCGFCAVPKKEGPLRKVGSIGELVNPRSNVVIILDNNFTADPDVLEKLREIRDRQLVIDITQGIDIRTMTPDIARALAEVKHLRSIHYAWDLMPFERRVMEGIEVLSHYVKRWRHLCFTLVGYDTSFDEDMYRFRRLVELGIDPYVMIYNKKEFVRTKHLPFDALRLHHFARWVNGRIYTKCPDFDQYDRWANAQASHQPALLAI